MTIFNTIEQLRKENSITEDAAKTLVAHVAKVVEDNTVRMEAIGRKIAEADAALSNDMDKLISAVEQFANERVMVNEALIGAPPVEFRQAAE
jgi:predicted hydrocarbon binding protein